MSVIVLPTSVSPGNGTTDIKIAQLNEKLNTNPTDEVKVKAKEACDGEMSPNIRTEEETSATPKIKDVNKATGSNDELSTPEPTVSKYDFEIDATDEKIPTKAEVTKTPKKRGRPKKSDAEDEATPKSVKRAKRSIKSDPEDENVPKSESTVAKSTPKGKQKPVKGENAKSSGSKGRGRPSGAASGEQWTLAQDAYIRQLFTGSEMLTRGQVHQKFEDIFQTGRSMNSVRFRWYKLQTEDIVLKPEEETALREAIDLIRKNPAQAILNEYHSKGPGEGFTKLNQGFVNRRIKEMKNSDGSVGDASATEDGDQKGEDGVGGNDD